MNKKLLVLVLMVALLFVATGAASAATSPLKPIQLQPDTSIDVVCDGLMEADVVYIPGQSVVHVYCYDIN